MKRRGFMKSLAAMCALPFVAKAFPVESRPNVSDEYAGLTFDGPLRPAKPYAIADFKYGHGSPISVNAEWWELPESVREKITIMMGATWNPADEHKIRTHRREL